MSQQPAPYYFDEFFASGKEESVSPFLTPTSRKWGKNLSLRSAIASAILLALAFALSFYNSSLSHLCLLGVYFLAGTPALIGALEDIKNLEINIDVLMTVAALLSALIGSELEGGLLLVLFELSASMEDAVARKTRSTLIHLNTLSPPMATVIADDGILYERSLREIPVGSSLLVKAGEIIPLDGIVIAGSSYVNLAHLTGESAPIAKKKSDEVPAGGLNLDGTLTINVIRTSSDSTLSRIIQQITAAQQSKPKLARFLDHFGKWYALSIISLFFLLAATLPLFSSMPYFGFEGAIYRSLTFLIAASPCALILSTPMAYLSGLSCCAKRGLLLKGGAVFDRLFHCKAIAFDKTGTLTTGKLDCNEIRSLIPSPQISEERALSVAAALERNATHPIAQAILNLAHKRDCPTCTLQDFSSLPGYGLTATTQIENHNLRVFIGHETYLEEKMSAATKKQWEEIKPSLSQEERTRAYLLIGDALFCFYFIDEIRPDAASSLTELRQEHFSLIMLTGDYRANAQKVAQQLQITQFFSELRPEDKLRKVSSLSKTEGLAMVGDGMNDAPALARATVGISMGKVGSATAIDASDIVFLHDDLSLLPWLFRKASQMRRVIYQNLSLSLAVICGAAIPALLGLIPLWIAVILHEGGTLLVGLNSLRLLSGKRADR